MGDNIELGKWLLLAVLAYFGWRYFYPRTREEKSTEPPPQPGPKQLNEQTAPARRYGFLFVDRCLAPRRLTLFNAWFFAGLSLMILSLALLEWQTPCYFTQDDNYNQFLPVILQAGESLFSGRLSTWNPYQIMGAPTASLGVYALTYPFTYISYGLATYVLGHQTWTLEVFAALHLLGGYVFLYLLLLSLRVRPSLAALGAICFNLSGYSLIAGNSWYYMLPVGPWFSLGLFCFIRLRERPWSWGYLIGEGAALGLLYHSGNVQMWIYALLFLSLFVVGRTFLAQRPRWELLLEQGCALAITLGLSLPLLLAQYHEIGRIVRDPWTGGIGGGLWSMLFPWPLTHSALPTDWGNKNTHLLTQFYYSGTILPLAALSLVLLAARAALLRPKFEAAQLREALSDNLPLLAGALAFILALGPAGGLWSLMLHLPPFNSFALPFKFLHYVNIFLILSGCQFCERLLAYVERAHVEGRAKRVELAFTAMGALLIMYHVSHCDTSFYSFSQPPYPRLAESLRAERPQRQLIMVPERIGADNYFPAMNYHFPMLNRQITFSGYDLLVDKTAANAAILKIFYPQVIEHSKIYGIDRILIYDYPQSEAHRHRDHFYLAKKKLAADLLEQGARPFKFDENITVYHLQDAAPLAFRQDDPRRALDFQLRADGISVLVPPSTIDGLVVINWACRERMIAEIDGRKAPISCDEYVRVTVPVSAAAGDQTINIYYRPFRAASLGGAAALIGLALFAVARLRRTKS